MVDVKSVSALDLRKHVGQLLDEAAAGERIVIERGGQPLCALVPLRDLEATDPDRRRERRLAALEDLRRLAKRYPLPSDFDATGFIRQARLDRGEQIWREVQGSGSRREDR